MQNELKPNIKKSRRYHGFDMLRAMAMLLGIPFHACLSYGINDYHWVVSDMNGSVIMDYFNYFIRSFRMPLFFLIAGFFGHLVFLRYKDHFLADRLRRITLPLIIFAIILLPPLKGLWLIGERPSLLFSGQFLELWNYILINFWKGPEGAHFRYPVNFAHLWFLLYLTIFNIFTFFFMKFERPKLINSILTRSHLFGAVILTTLSLCTMSGTWTDKPFTLWPKVSLLFYYGIFYFYGWLLFESRDILDLHSQHKRKWKILSICGLIIIGTRVYYQVNLLSIFNVSPIILHAWMAIGTWLIIIGAVIYAESIVKKSSLVVNYLVKASYFLYLSHLPVVVAVQLFLYDVDMNWFMKFLTANIVTLILIIPLYHYLIRDKVVDHF